MKKTLAYIMVVMFVVMFSAQVEAFLWFKDKKECDLMPDQLTTQVAELQQTVETLKGELAVAQQELSEANAMISALNEKLVGSGVPVDSSANAEACCGAMGTDDCCSQVTQDSAAAQ